MSNIDWEHWKLEKKLPIWQVMLLSLGVNPDKVKLKLSPEATFFALKPDLQFNSIADRNGLGAEVFEKRLTILQKRRFDEKFDSGNQDIDLEKFVNWATKENLPIPDELKSLYGLLVTKEQFQVVDGKQYFNNQAQFVSVQFKTQQDWVEVVRNVVKLRCDHEINKSKIIQKDLAIFAEGYLHAFRATGPKSIQIKAETIMKEAFRAEQWWKRSIKPE
jgi:hypothetical protein